MHDPLSVVITHLDDASGGYVAGKFEEIKMLRSGFWQGQGVVAGLAVCPLMRLTAPLRRPILAAATGLPSDAPIATWRDLCSHLGPRERIAF